MALPCRESALDLWVDKYITLTLKGPCADVLTILQEFYLLHYRGTPCSTAAYSLAPLVP